MNTNYAVLVVWDCDADRVIWRGDYVFCKFIQSDCCKIGDEKYVSGKYSIDEIQQLSKVTEMWKKSTTRTAVFSNMDEEKCMWIWYFLPIWFFSYDFFPGIFRLFYTWYMYPNSMFWSVIWLFSISVVNVNALVNEWMWHPLFSRGKIYFSNVRLINHPHVKR